MAQQQQPAPAPAAPAQAQTKPEATQGVHPDFARLLEQQSNAAEFNIFGNLKNFTEAQRMAKALYTSQMVPENYRGEQNLGNVLIALEISNRIGMNVLAVMQNLYTVHGKPGWSAQFLISCVNASKKFTPLRYEFTDLGEIETAYSFNKYVGGQKQRESGKMTVQNKRVVAWAIDRTGQKLVSPPVTISMAVEEGWYTKDGSKWKTMPDLMLCYRAATFFARLYAPELTMGIQTKEELQDIEGSAPTPENQGFSKPKGLFTRKKGEPKEEKKEDPDAGSDLGPDYLSLLAAKMVESGRSDAQVLNAMRDSGLVDDSLRSLQEVSLCQPKAIEEFYKNWDSINKTIPQ